MNWPCSVALGPIVRAVVGLVVLDGALGISHATDAAAGKSGDSSAPAGAVGGKEAKVFVRVSGRDRRYFELSDGRPYVPIGLNMLAPRGAAQAGPAAAVAQMEAWLKELSDSGGNFARVWLSNPLWDVEHRRSGQYAEDAAKRIDALLAAAGRYGIRLKLCLEHFRSLEGHRWANKPLHHVSRGGPADSIADFFDGERSRKQFQAKLAWLASRWGADPAVFGWELWNEVDCVAGGDWMAWTRLMLGELHRLLPQVPAMQSLGSFDTDAKRKRYRDLCCLDGNDVAQVHRYLDLGAALAVCRGPVDVLAADAVRELVAFKPGKPILLAESGAVEPRHTGPFKLYDKDRAGIILHDVLFAPFFAGAAGAGHVWHWEAYVHRMNLWRHFGRFATAIRGVDPPAEGFQALSIEHPRLRVYVLKGRQTLLAWCRDKQNTWQTELAEGRPPEVVRGAAIDLGPHAAAFVTAPARAYDPWADRWADVKLDGARAVLPDFSRSIVLRLGPPARGGDG